MLLQVLLLVSSAAPVFLQPSHNSKITPTSNASSNEIISGRGQRQTTTMSAERSGTTVNNYQPDTQRVEDTTTPGYYASSAPSLSSQAQLPSDSLLPPTYARANQLQVQHPLGFSSVPFSSPVLGAPVILQQGQNLLGSLSLPFGAPTILPQAQILWGSPFVPFGQTASFPQPQIFPRPPSVPFTESVGPPQAQHSSGSSVPFSASMNLTQGPSVPISASGNSPQGQQSSDSSSVQFSASANLPHQYTSGSSSVQFSVSATLPQGQSSSAFSSVQFSASVTFPHDQHRSGSMSGPVSASATSPRGQHSSGSISLPVSTLASSPREQHSSGSTSLPVPALVTSSRGQQSSGSISLPVPALATSSRGQHSSGSISLPVSALATSPRGQHSSGSISLPVSALATSPRGQHSSGSISLPVSALATSPRGQHSSGSSSVQISTSVLPPQPQDQSQIGMPTEMSTTKKAKKSKKHKPQKPCSIGNQRIEHSVETSAQSSSSLLVVLSSPPVISPIPYNFSTNLTSTIRLPTERNSRRQLSTATFTTDSSDIVETTSGIIPPGRLRGSSPMEHRDRASSRFPEMPMVVECPTLGVDDESQDAHVIYRLFENDDGMMTTTTTSANDSAERSSRSRPRRLCFSENQGVGCSEQPSSLSLAPLQTTVYLKQSRNSLGLSSTCGLPSPERNVNVFPIPHVGQTSTVTLARNSTSSSQATVSKQTPEKKKKQSRCKRKTQIASDQSEMSQRESQNDPVLSKQRKI